MAYLSIENYSKSFGTVKAVKDLSFDLEKGKVLSIIGSSGSGKTTLLRCLNFLDLPDSGKITLDDKVLFDTANFTKKPDENYLRDIRLNFGLVFQSFNLFPQYTVLKNITLAPKLRLKEAIKEYKKTLKNSDNGLIGGHLRQKLKEYEQSESKLIDQKALNLIEKVNLTDKKDCYPHQLSGGQKQRVAIARALISEPKILCFDEPTSALDPELTGEVLKVIKELKATSNITMIIVTHEMQFARQISDKVIFMSNGQIIESGTSEQVFINPQNQLTKQFIQGYNI